MQPLTEAQQKLVEDNIYLAKWFAGKKQRILPHEEFEEILSLCQLGLVHAARRFDPSRGIRFSTYACLSMFRQLQNSLEREGRRVVASQSEWDSSIVKDAGLVQVDIEDEARWILSHIHIPQEHRDALRSVYYDGQNGKETSIQLGYSRGWFHEVVLRGVRSLLADEEQVAS